MDFRRTSSIPGASFDTSPVEDRLHLVVRLWFYQCHIVMKRLRRASTALSLLLVLAACDGQPGQVTSASSTTSVLPPTTSTVPIPTTSTTTSSTTTTSTTTPTTVEGPTVLTFEPDPAECSEDMGVIGTVHTIDESADPIRAAFELWLVASLGVDSAEGMLLSTVVDDGLLTVDFGDLRSLMNNASTSCGAFELRAVLNATAFQFPEVDRVTYQIEGSCKTFEDWLQRAECHVYTRP